QRTRMLMALLLCLRGTIFLYQGEELGLPQANVPFEKLRDPEAIRFWPESIGRDGARTPMPWAATGGFTSNAEPWLPMYPRHLKLNAEDQEKSSNSMFTFTRDPIALRKTYRALRDGDWNTLSMNGDMTAFERTLGEERIMCVFNLGNEKSGFTHAD